LRRCRPPLIKAVHVLAVVAVCACGLLLASPAMADQFRPDTTPLPSDVTGGGSAATAAPGTGTGAIVRGVVGLAIVLAVIYGLYWLLRTTTRGRKGKGDSRIEVVATTQLAQHRSLHLVRTGDEMILVGTSEHSVTPLRVYAAGEAVALGLTEPEAEPEIADVTTVPGTVVTQRRPRLALNPGQGVLSTVRGWTVRS
jgi:flagellar protein FliO/FliZ